MRKKCLKKVLDLFVLMLMAFVPLSPVLGASTVGNNVSVGGTLAVTGASTLTGATTLAGAATLSSTLGVTGLSTLTGGFIAASSTVTSLNVSGNLSASSTMTLAGAATLSSTLGVTGLSTLTGGFISSASSSISGGLNVNGNFNASGTSQFGGNLLSGTNNSYALGTFGNAFSDVYSSGTVFSNLVFAKDGSMTAPAYSWVGDSDTGIFRPSVGGATGFMFTVNGLSQLSISASSTVPNGLGSVSLGQYYNSLTDKGPFGNIYSSSSLFAASSTLSNTGTSTLFLDSANSARGGQIVFKAADGVSCLALYFGAGGVESNGGTGLGLVTSTITCPK